jgi:hypothetical protein
MPAVFISYNPDSEAEQTLALRLHTIGAVHGFNMILPDRSLSSRVVSPETKGRIQLSDYFIVFSTESLSAVVMDEIGIAFSKHHDKSKILVIYDKSRSKKVAGLENCTEVYIDTREDVLKNVNDIAAKLKSVNPGTDDLISVLGGILLVGVGLFALSEIFSAPARPKKSTSIVKRKKRTNA